MKHSVLFNRLYRKISSQKGASLSFALMLLLVSAVVGAVLLHAATAAAGRVSQLAAADARYYGVTSAADIIAAELENAKVTIVREETKQWSKSTPITENEYNVVQTGLTTETVPTYHYTSYFLDRTNLERGRSMIMDWAIDKVMGENCTSFTEYNNDVWSRNKLNGSEIKYEYTLEHTLAEEFAGAAAPMTIQMIVEMQPNGNLYVLLYNKDDSERYRVQLTYSAEVKENNVVTESVKTNVIPRPGNVKNVLPYTVDEVKEHTLITTKTTSICWTLIDRKELGYE